MFFRWFAQNRYFKPRANLAGQVMPFLLVIIAVFLGAFVATARIGTVAYNMTCNDNAADACALAAASRMALAMNAIHRAQVDVLDPLFLAFRANLELLSQAERETLENANSNLSLALESIDTALGLISPLPGPYCTIWNNSDLAATTYLDAAADLVADVSTLLDDLAIAVVLKQTYVETSQEDAWTAFCEALDFFEFEYELAKTDGVDYAIENNCVTAGLSASQQEAIQNEQDRLHRVDVNEQASFEEFTNQGNLIPLHTERTVVYDWEDSKNNPHRMEAVVTLPRVSAFELEVTKMNKPCAPMLPDGTFPTGEDDNYGIIALQELSAQLAVYAEQLRTLRDEETSIYVGTLFANDCGEDNDECCWDEYVDLDNRNAIVIGQLTGLQTNLQTVVDTYIPALITHVDTALADLGRDDPIRTINARTCNGANEVFVVAINDVIFETGCLNCSMIMYHGSAEGGLPTDVTSMGRSTAVFGGGSLKASEPDSHYIPDLRDTPADLSCPADSGVTVGSPGWPSGFDQTDEGCSAGYMGPGDT